MDRRPRVCLFRGSDRVERRAMALVRFVTKRRDRAERFAVIFRRKAASTPLATYNTTPTRLDPLVLSPRHKDYNGRRRPRKRDAKLRPEVVTPRRGVYVAFTCGRPTRENLNALAWLSTSQLLSLRIIEIS